MRVDALLCACVRAATDLPLSEVKKRDSRILQRKLQPLINAHVARETDVFLQTCDEIMQVMSLDSLGREQYATDDFRDDEALENVLKTAAFLLCKIDGVPHLIRTLTTRAFRADSDLLTCTFDYDHDGNPTEDRTLDTWLQIPPEVRCVVRLCNSSLPKLHREGLTRGLDFASIKFPSEWTMMELAVRAFLSPSEHDRRVYYRQLWHHLAFSRTLFLEEMLSNFDRSSVVHRLMAMLCDKTLLHGCTELYREDDHLRFIRNTAVRRVAHLESIPGGRMRFEQPMTKRCAFMFYSCCIAESSELIELMHGDLIRWPGDPYLIAHFVQATVRVLLNEKEERVCLTREQRAVVWDWLYSSITELNGLLCRRTLPLLCSSVDICDYCPRKKVYVINPSPFMQLLELQITDPHSVDYNPLEWRLAAVVTSWIATDAFSFDPDSDRRQVQQCRDWLMRVGAFYYDDAACEWLFRNVRDSGDAAIADGSLCILLRSPDGVEWGRRVFRETLADSGSDFVCLHNPIVFFWTMVSLGASVEHDADSTRTLSDAVATLCRDANDTDTDTDTDADRAEVTRASRTLTQHLQRHRLELFEPFAQLLRQHTPLPLELIDEVRDYSLCAALPRVLPRVFRDGFIGPRATREIIATPNSDWHLPVTSRRPLES